MRVFFDQNLAALILAGGILGFALGSLGYVLWAERPPKNKTRDLSKNKKTN